MEGTTGLKIYWGPDRGLLRSEEPVRDNVTVPIRDALPMLVAAVFGGRSCSEEVLDEELTLSLELYNKLFESDDDRRPCA